MEQLLKLASTTVGTGAPAPVWPARNRCFFSQIVDGSISREHLAEVGVVWGGVQCVNGYSSITHDPLLSGFRGRA